MVITEGEKLSEIAKKAVGAELTNTPLQIDEALKRKFSSMKRGLFVTIKNKKGKLRGSMGYPQPVYNVLDTVIRAAKLAAFNDPRTLPIKEEELPKLIFRISVLTEPEEVVAKTPEERLKKIAGKGVMVKFGPFKGTLLPEDAEKFKWNAKELLENTCIKAGLAPEMWKDMQLKVFIFQTEVFEG